MKKINVLINKNTLYSNIRIKIFYNKIKQEKVKYTYFLIIYRNKYLNI